MYHSLLLRVPWTARRSNQSILKEITPGCSLEGLMLKLKLQYLMRRNDSMEKPLMLGKIEGRRKRGPQKMRWLDVITDSRNMFEQTPGAGDGQGSLACCSPLGHKVSDMTERLNWTEMIYRAVYISLIPTSVYKRDNWDSEWYSASLWFIQPVCGSAGPRTHLCRTILWKEHWL